MFLDLSIFSMKTIFFKSKFELLALSYTRASQPVFVAGQNNPKL